VRPRKPLSVLSPTAPEGLGVETIMDRTLAARFGVPYVHLAVFAIDLDRVNVEVAGREDWPTGWEVFLTEVHLLAHLDPADPEQRELIDEVCAGIIEGGQALGAQIPFAVFDAVERGAWPEDLRGLFRPWRGGPRGLVAQLAPLWEDPQGARERLAGACLGVALDPPLAPPTVESLERMRA
jgi:hypothetical protein